MKFIKIITCLVLLWAIVMKAAACDCGYNGSFMNVAHKVETVVLVKIVRYKNVQNTYNLVKALAMEVKVIKTYKGNVTESVITIWGDDGMQCRPYVNEFTIGNEYIIALNKIPVISEKQNDKSTDFYVSICGAYWLSVNNMQLVYGNIDSSIRLSSVTTLSRFEAELKKRI